MTEDYLKFFCDSNSHLGLLCNGYNAWLVMSNWKFKPHSDFEFLLISLAELYEFSNSKFETHYNGN